MAKVSKEDILTAISEMSVMDIVDLIKEMEDKFGVSAAAAAVQVAAPADAVVVEEQTEFNVVLSKYGENKVAVIKVVREITGLGLKEAKDLVESAPANIKESIAKADAEAMKKKIEDAGGSVDIK